MWMGEDSDKPLSYIYLYFSNKLLDDIDTSKN